MSASLRIIGLVITATACCTDHRTMLFREVRGEVRHDGERVASACVGAAGKEILVGRGRAIIEIEGLGSVRVFSDTRLRIKPRRQMSRVELLSGQIWALIDHRDGPGSFEVETMNAVAGVRGTELIVVSKEDETEVRVLRGKAVVANRHESDATRELRQGQRSIIRGRDRPTAPEPYDGMDHEILWERLRQAFAEIKELAQKGAKAIKQTVQEAAPEVQRGLHKGGRRLREGLKEIFPTK